MLAALSTALETVLPARKAYVAFLAEAEGFEHLHVQVVIGEEGMPAGRRGKRVFDRLAMPGEEAVTDEEADRITSGLRPAVAQQMSSWPTKRPPEPGVCGEVCQ